MNTHKPWPLIVDTGEVIGGAPVITGQELQIRCACRVDLAHDYGHEQEAA